MKNSLIRNIMTGVAVSMVISCNSAKTDAGITEEEKDKIKNEIQAREDEFAELYNTGQLKEIGYYADDAISFYQNKAPLVGKPAILEFLRADLDSNTNRISFTTNEVFPSSDGKQVVELGYFKLFDSNKVMINSGNYMVLFEKRDGKYVCLRDMSVSERE